jgi:hypothetical protein
MPVDEREVRVKGIIVVIALAAVPAFADDVYLRGGGRITGEIIEQTEDSVSVDIGGGSLTVKMSSVERIEKSVSPMQKYRARAGEIATGDAEAWRELARWATGNALASQVATRRRTARWGGSVSTGGGSARRKATKREATSSSKASG